MKLLYVFPFISGFGGISRTLITKANYFVQHYGYEVVLITFQRNPDIVFPLDKRIQIIDLGLYVYSLKGWNRLKATFKLFHRIRQEIYRLRPDIVISLASTKETAWLWMLRDGSKKVLEVHSCFHFVFSYIRTFGKIGGYINGLVNLLVRINIRKSDAYVVLTERDKNLYQKANICTPYVIPNPNPVKSLKKATLDSKIISCIGRISPEKNFAGALNIWKKVHAFHPDWKLYIYGDGPDKDAILKLIDKLELNEAVVVTYAKDMEQAYMNTSILMMTSFYEGLPMTLIEAASYGIPCIAYDIDCGPSDVIKDAYNGYLIPPFDESLFQQKLMNLIEKTDLRKEMGENSLNQAVCFNIDAVMDKWKILFESIKKQ